jgi:hypothetical protein
LLGRSGRSGGVSLAVAAAIMLAAATARAREPAMVVEPCLMSSSSGLAVVGCERSRAEYGTLFLEVEPYDDSHYYQCT